jgi:hypothetical protein
MINFYLSPHPACLFEYHPHAFHIDQVSLTLTLDTAFKKPVFTCKNTALEWQKRKKNQQKKGKPTTFSKA